MTTDLKINMYVYFFFVYIKGVLSHHTPPTNMASSLGNLAGRNVGSMNTVDGKDNSFTKSVLQEGQSDDTPTDGSVCSLCLWDVGK